MIRKWHDEKQFGRVVGIAFFALGAIGVWRGTWPTVGLILMALGSTLAVLGFVAPQVLVHPRRLWMRLAEALSFVSTRIILGTVFISMMTPIGFINRRRGRDPLGRRGAAPDTRWYPYPARQKSTRHFEKMY
jgi:hypothetical protein